MDLDEAVDLIAQGYQRVADEAGLDAPSVVDSDTPLVGPDSVLDSMALVSLVLDVEQRLDEERGHAVSLMDERALSRSHSPFRTIGSLAAYVCESIGDPTTTT